MICPVRGVVRDDAMKLLMDALVYERCNKIPADSSVGRTRLSGPSSAAGCQMYLFSVTDTFSTAAGCLQVSNRQTVRPPDRSGSGMSRHGFILIHPTIQLNDCPDCRRRGHRTAGRHPGRAVYEQADTPHRKRRPPRRDRVRIRGRSGRWCPERRQGVRTGHR